MSKQTVTVDADVLDALVAAVGWALVNGLRTGSLRARAAEVEHAYDEASGVLEDLPEPGATVPA